MEKSCIRERTHTKTMKFLKDDKHCPYLFDRRYGLYFYLFSNEFISRTAEPLVLMYYAENATKT